MATHPKFMIGAGIAIAGLGLIGAGAGATFTAQVSSTSDIRTGDLGLSLNGEAGSDVDVKVDGRNLGSHFAPITKELRLKNTGTLDMASTYLDVTATGCRGGVGAPLAEALEVTFTRVPHGELLYAGSLCSLSRSLGQHDVASTKEHDFVTPPAHADVGGRLPRALRAGRTIHYRLVIEPGGGEQGLPTAAQDSSVTIKLVFSGFDY